MAISLSDGRTSGCCGPIYTQGKTKVEHIIPGLHNIFNIGATRPMFGYRGTIVPIRANVLGGLSTGSHVSRGAIVRRGRMSEHHNDSSSACIAALRFIATDDST